MTFSWRLVAILVAVGSAWGLTIPLTKIAVSTGFHPLGLIMWETAIGATLIAMFLVCQRRRARWRWRHLRLLLFVACVGTMIPQVFSYRAAAELPAGVMAILIALVPMLSLPIALVIGQELFQARRGIGVVLGAIAVVMIFAPETSLPDPAKAGFVFVALMASVCYAVEGNVVAWWGTDGLGADEILLGSSLIGFVSVAPIALATNTAINPFGAWSEAHLALVALSALHICAYTAYLWLVRHTGPVFAAQVAYLSTGTGVLWSILILSESYSIWIWAALIVMLAGLSLVRPISETERRATAN